MLTIIFASLMHRATVAKMIFYLEPNKKAEAVKLIEESSNNTASSLIEITQVERLVRYIVEEAPEEAEKGRTFNFKHNQLLLSCCGFPFIVCDLYCEVDIILKALVEDEELMNLLFSFIEPEHPNSALPVISVNVRVSAISLDFKLPYATCMSVYKMPPLALLLSSLNWVECKAQSWSPVGVAFMTRQLADLHLEL
ncbi:serine/threonine-protein phosphatase 6 regulatory subunit 3-like protein [Tanacetum coccineum]